MAGTNFRKIEPDNFLVYYETIFITIVTFYEIFDLIFVLEI